MAKPDIPPTEHSHGAECGAKDSSSEGAIVARLMKEKLVSRLDSYLLC
jgi:hypothetical protein